MLNTQVASALNGKGAVLSQLGQVMDEMEAYDGVVGRFAGNPEPAVRVQVGFALTNKGNALVRLNRLDEALAAYDEVAGRLRKGGASVARRAGCGRPIPQRGGTRGAQPVRGSCRSISLSWRAVFSEVSDPTTLEIAAQALFNAGAILDELGRWEGKLARFVTKSYNCFGHSDAPKFVHWSPDPRSTGAERWPDLVAWPRPSRPCEENPVPFSRRERSRHCGGCSHTLFCEKRQF